MANPSVPDLLKDSSDPLGTDNEYFLVTIVDLELATTYPIQFAWKFKDGTVSEDWSAAKNITTNGETTLNKPKFLETDLSSNASTLIIKWSGVDYLNSPYGSNLERVDVYIRGGSYGATSVAANTYFTATGTKLLTVDTGTNYYVKLRAVSKLGAVSDFSDERMASPVAPFVVDTTAPSAPTTGTLTAGIDNSSGATIGFNAFIDITWNAVSDSTLRGYRIRFRKNGSSDPYSYVDSPGTGTSYRLNGLAIGTTYEVAVASYDELNNTSSSYTSIGTATATGTPFIGKNVTTVGYFGASATGETGEFRFGYGVETGKRGLRFDANNYWYIDSLAAASFRLGGPSSNYLQWNGSTFTIDGNITARGGSFSGNVAMTTSGASIYNGTLDGSGALTTSGFILNNTGLQFKYLDPLDSLLKDRITLRVSDGALIANNATITGTIQSSQIYGSTIATDSSSTARRAIFNPTTHALSFYASGGAGQAHVSPLNDASNPGVIISAGSSPLSSILLGNDPSILIYKNSSTATNYMTLSVGSAAYLGLNSSSGPQWVGTVGVGEFGLGSGYLRNMETVTTTNWGSGSGYSSYGTEGQVMLVYTP